MTTVSKFGTEAEGVLQFRQPKEESYWGDCPKCGSSDGYLNIGRDHWFRCDEHKVAWCVGSNPFSSWQEENDEIWLANANKLAAYKTI